MKQLIHKDNVGYGNCDGLLLYCGEWRYNGEVVPHKHKLVCKRCREGIVADSEKLYGIIKDVKYQLKLNI